MNSHEEIILHLIKQDILYHRMIYGLQEYEVHIEFYPDIITAVLALMGISSESVAEVLTDRYTEMVGTLSKECDKSSEAINSLAIKCLQELSESS